MSITCFLASAWRKGNVWPDNVCKGLSFFSCVHDANPESPWCCQKAFCHFWSLWLSAVWRKFWINIFSNICEEQVSILKWKCKEGHDNGSVKLSKLPNPKRPCSIFHLVNIILAGIQHFQIPNALQECQHLIEHCRKCCGWLHLNKYLKNPRLSVP